ncbi:TonB-dependent receptor [Klebsiella pneumoniae]|uniref:TonB-dependent receptor n=1 Tax=Klebsiella pneumoniae TaxID=573 RepID=A0A377ZBY4_KLEPN|nr:TonB-dependent receptor [Klebsiella pneumoniae]
MQSLEFEAGYSRQGNLYAGDTQNTNSNDLVKEKLRQRDQPSVSQHLLGYLERRWDNGVTTSNWAQYERTATRAKAKA